MNVLYIPNDVLHIILEYDGRIKYENGKYINKISKHDFRYNIIEPIIVKKREISKKSEIYREFFFDDYNFNNNKLNTFYDYYLYYSCYSNDFVSCFYKYKYGKITINYHTIK